MIVSGSGMRTHRQRQGDRREQSLRHVCDNNTYGKNEGSPKRQTYRLTDEKKDHTERQREPGDNAAYTDNFHLQGRNSVVGRLRELGNFTKRGVRTSCEDKCLALPGYERSADEKRVAAMHGVGFITRIRVTRDRQGLSGDGCIVYPHTERLHQPTICWQYVSCFEQNHIARHKLGCRHLPHRA